MPYGIAIVLGMVFAVAATVLAYIFIIPESRRSGTSKLIQILHDILNFKHLLIETIMKFLYVFGTLASVSVGFFMLFSVQRYGSYYTRSMFSTGLIMLFVVPILLRLVFEATMLMVIMAKHLGEINKKTPALKPAAQRVRRPEPKPVNEDYNSYE